MAVLIGEITAQTTVFDNATLQLDDAWNVAAATVGGITFVYATGAQDDGVSGFELGADGSLANVENVTDAGALELDLAASVISATVGATAYLYVGGSEDDGISAFRVEADGSLTNVDNVDDDATLELDYNYGRMSTATVGGTPFLIATGHDDNGFSVFRVESDGTLTNTDNVTDGGALEVAGAWDSTTATIGGATFVFVAGFADDGLSVFEVAGDGGAINVENVTDDATLQLDGAAGVATAAVDGTTYLIASGFEDDGLSVFSVSGTGQLTNVFNVEDSAARGLQAANSMTAFTLDSETFVVVSGQDDDALTIFHLGSGGVLTDVTTIFDNVELALQDTNGNSVVTVGGVPLLLGIGFLDDGLSVFDIGSGDDSLVGTGSGDLLLGLAGNDILDGGDGDDELRGGTGNDVLNGGAGDDAMAGGSDDDSYVVDAAGDTVAEEPGGGRDTVQASIDYLLGGEVEGLILLGDAALSGTGNGLANGITGNGAGNRLVGKGGGDELFGKGGKDELNGGNGKDNLSGGGKGDELFGGKGKDILAGQGGNDDFVFTKTNQSGLSKSDRDQILEFKGKDDIVLTDIDAVKGVAGNQDFVLDTDGSFEAGEVRLREVKAGVRVEINVDGDAKAEMSILLKGFDGRLDASDFEF